jgi:hypothetical protein
VSGTLAVMARPRKHDDTETTRLARALMRMIRTIANRRDQSVPDYIHERLTPLVQEDYAEAVAEMAKEVGVKAPKRKPD